MYTTQDTEKSPIRLFEFPNTLAGDAVVTIFVQTLITWLIELLLVNRDLRTAHVAPIGFVAEPAPHRRLLRWFLLLDRASEQHEPGSAAHWARFLLSQVLRALLVGVAAFVVLWGPAVGILTAVGEHRGGDWSFHDRWAPQVFKLVFGGVLALLTTPLFAAFWLVRCGWAMKTNERHYGER